MDVDTPPTRESILLAKTKALDSFFSDNVERFASSWDLNFIASILDWQQLKKLRLTDKQVKKLEEVYADHELEEMEDFTDGGKYHYEAFLE